MPIPQPIPRSGPAGGGRERALLALLLLAIVSATASRLIGLEHLPVWHDEAFTLTRVFGYAQEEVQQALFSERIMTPADVLRFQQPNPANGWVATLRALTQHPEHAPLYYLLGRAATALPLDPVTALRGTSALFGLLLPGAAFWLMRELFGRGPVPWVAAALVAFSPLHLLYAQEARQYALWTLLVLAASAALQRAVRDDRRADWWLYAGLVVVGLYAHLLFLLLLPVHAAYGWLVRAHATGNLLRPRGLPLRQWLTALGLALLLFLPWLVVLVLHFDRAVHFTSWMERPVGTDRVFVAWGQHLLHSFVDLSPREPSMRWLLLLLPLGWAVLHYLRRAPRPALWLLPLIAAAYIGIVLGPDLLLGGSRSLHARYALPALLALQLMVAWSIGDGIAHAGAIGRPVAAASLVLLMLLGGLSLWRIAHTESWWSKNFSADNIDIARLANASVRPLIAASPSGVATGEMLSVAYYLDDRVRLWGETANGTPTLPAGFGDIILLTPTDALRAALGPGRRAEPIDDSWQWLYAPSPAAPGPIAN